ncbi:peptidoglycan-binding protein [Bosea sp. (in: a-proteobacteria)]|uniref:peptidoglycan-binding protein n=1 Tax=Bosea sp. (in: a-proteobacteria) TaxID=1871050 RepID=UPI001AD28051|nr:peptidoglycan-binding protein [Bosea sp. (in: a-proteobacteria)]MBN9438968.1 peptidoglycan-binding protein [Bosea sp. (in: a-proteobacteria)]
MQLVERIGANTLRAIAPAVTGSKKANQAAIIAAVGPAMSEMLTRYDITTARRIEHFIGQAAHESAGFCTTEEYASGAKYEGRADLGNVQNGDGRRYKGRGIFQLTGRANYQRYGQRLGLDLIDKPQLAAEPVTSLEIACLYWSDRKIGPMADEDDLYRVTRAINGGTNGLADRRKYLTLAKREVAALVAAGVSSHDPVHYPVLRRGCEGASVETLQVWLRSRGYQLTIDGDFGAATELAVKTFQNGVRLKVDGVVGPATWGALTPKQDT